MSELNQHGLEFSVFDSMIKQMNNVLKITKQIFSNNIEVLSFYYTLQHSHGKLKSKDLTKLHQILIQTKEISTTFDKAELSMMAITFQSKEELLFLKRLIFRVIQKMHQKFQIMHLRKISFTDDLRQLINNQITQMKMLMKGFTAMSNLQQVVRIFKSLQKQNSWIQNQIYEQLVDQDYVTSIKQFDKIFSKNGNSILKEKEYNESFSFVCQPSVFRVRHTNSLESMKFNIRSKLLKKKKWKKFEYNEQIEPDCDPKKRSSEIISTLASFVAVRSQEYSSLQSFINMNGMEMYSQALTKYFNILEEDQQPNDEQNSNNQFAQKTSRNFSSKQYSKEHIKSNPPQIVQTPSSKQILKEKPSKSIKINLKQTQKQQIPPKYKDSSHPQPTKRMRKTYTVKEAKCKRKCLSLGKVQCRYASNLNQNKQAAKEQHSDQTKSNIKSKKAKNILKNCQKRQLISRTASLQLQQAKYPQTDDKISKMQANKISEFKFHIIPHFSSTLDVSPLKKASKPHKKFKISHGNSDFQDRVFEKSSNITFSDKENQLFNQISKQNKSQSTHKKFQMKKYCHEKVRHFRKTAQNWKEKDYKVELQQKNTLQSSMKRFRLTAPSSPNKVSFLNAKNIHDFYKD